MISIIIPAGGSSVRFGGTTKKQFLTLKGQSILNLSIQAFLNHKDVAQVIVSLPHDELQRPDLLQNQRLLYVAGGQTRSASVHQGFLALTTTDPAQPILIHDAARPLVSMALIDRIVKATHKAGAAIPGLPVSDTIKEVGKDETILKTVPRASLRAVQTPQGFKYGLLQRCYAELNFSDAQYTDESMLIEALGHAVHVVEGERQNLKITNPFDLAIAKVILEAS